MAEEQKHKTPAELGEAVGKKIEELFGGLFSEDSAQEPKLQTPAPVSGAVGDSSLPSAPTLSPGPTKPESRPYPVERKAEPVRAPLAPSQNIPGPVDAPTSGRPQGGKVSFESIIERIEVLILNVEWEVSPKASAELVERLKELDRHFPGDERARTILAMNNRVLGRFSGADVSPHPLVVKLLEESLAVLKSIHSSPQNRSYVNAAIPALNNIYKKIMASAPREHPTVRAPSKIVEGKSSGPAHESILKKMSVVIQSLEEVSQRLSRIGAVLTQGTAMSGSETARRLGTLEQLVSQQVGHLSALHQELVRVRPSVGESEAGTEGNKGAPSGILTVLWAGMPLAIPSSMVAAMYPLTRAQAEQFMDKQSITLGSKVLQRLPFRKPVNTQYQTTGIPAWLVHLNWGQKDRFLLIDRSLGFRRIPTGNVTGQTRIKIGPVSYTILSESTLR